MMINNESMEDILWLKRIGILTSGGDSPGMNLCNTRGNTCWIK